MSTFDITTARDRFPALKQEQVYFDNAGGSQTLGTVIDDIYNYLSKTNVQLGATYNVGKESTKHYSAGYQAAAKYINTSPDNIVLGSATTQLFRNLSTALSFPAGSEIVISTVDHEANIAPWITMANSQNLTIKFWTPTPSTNPHLLVADLKKLLTEKTVLVTCTQASNIIGTINDIKSIAKAVHEVEGAMLAVDAVAYAPHRGIDVKDLGVDFYCFSWYKVYGPHISMLYASPTALPKVGSLGHFFNPSDTLSAKLGLAGSTYELTASLPSVVAYLSPPSTAWPAIEKHEGELQSLLLSYLTSRSDITILGESDPDTKKRVATVAFVVEGWGSRKVVEAVEEKSGGKMGIRWGGFYSERLVRDTLGLGIGEGVVRVSMVHYNTLDEVKQLIGLFDKVLGKSA